MTYLSREATGPIPPSSSAESTGGKGQPSSQSAGPELTPISTPPMPTQSPATNPADNSDNSPRTTPTTPEITEASRQHADIARAALLQLEKVGLLKRIKVLSPDPTTGKAKIDNTGKPVVKEHRIVFDPALWSEDLRLK